MRSLVDYTDDINSVNYGYTVDDDDDIWYWRYDGEEITFRDYGYHTDHPFKQTGEVPDDVREHAQLYIRRGYLD